MTAALAVTGLAAGGAVVAAAPAQAAVGYIYVSMPAWLGNCPSGGSVKVVRMSSFWSSGSAYAGDSGDDLVYLRVGLNDRVQLAGGGICYKSGSPPTYNAPTVNRYIWPTRNGQTFWVGPNGIRNN